MAGYNSLEGLRAKRVISAIGGNRRLRSGRFSYQIVDGGKSVRSGRCHIFIGAGHVTFVEPRNGDAFGWTLDEIDRVELQKRMMNTDILRVTTTGGAMIEVTDTVEMDGRQISAINDALKQTSGEMDPLRGLASFEFMVKSARQEAEVAARRADAITRGELLPEDMKALGESVDAYAPCTHLGTLLPPKGPEGPTFHGYVLAGGSCFGIILGQGQLYARFSYADVAAVAWRPVKADTSRWLVSSSRTSARRSTGRSAAIATSTGASSYRP